MINKEHIIKIEKLLNNETILNFELLQISFDIACVKFEISNNTKFIAKFYINNNKHFNAINSEAKNLSFLNNRFDFFPKIIKNNNNYLIIQYFDNDNYTSKNTNSDFLHSIVKIHSITNDLYGFDFNTQFGAIELVNNYENSWVNFFTNKRLNSMFELANKKVNMGNFINEKITYLLNNMKNFIPNRPTPVLVHGDMWEGNILFKKNKFVGFIDPGSFFGHNEIEIAYLRWFNPLFIDSHFLEKYNLYIELNKNYLSYEPIYQLYYALSNVALWDASYIEKTKKLLIQLKV